MNHYFDRMMRFLPPAVGKMIHNVRIIVFGDGAAGNEVLKNLVLMGFRLITHVDFDHVEDSNLSRTVLFRVEDIGKPKAQVAEKRLREMALAENPEIVGLHGNLMTDFGKGRLFMDHDIVISCVDTQQCRAFISDWCVRTGTPFFEVGFEGFDTNITFFAPADGYVQVSDGKAIDSLPSSDGFFPKPTGKLEVCLREEIGQGTFDGRRNSCSGFKMADRELAKIPTIQTAAAMAGAMVATELVKYLCGKDTLRNKILYYYGLTHETLCCSYRQSPNCTIHRENMPIRTLRVESGDSFGAIIAKIRERWDAYPVLQVPPFVFSGHCACCGREREVNKAEREMYDDERWCGECRSRYPDYQVRLEHPNQWRKTPAELTEDSEPEFLALLPKDVGIPEDDIIRVTLIGEDSYEKVFLRMSPK